MEQCSSLATSTEYKRFKSFLFRAAYFGGTSKTEWKVWGFLIESYKVGCSIIQNNISNVTLWIKEMHEFPGVKDSASQSLLYRWIRCKYTFFNGGKDDCPVWPRVVLMKTLINKVYMRSLVNREDLTTSSQNGKFWDHLQEMRNTKCIYSQREGLQSHLVKYYYALQSWSEQEGPKASWIMGKGSGSALTSAIFPNANTYLVWNLWESKANLLTIFQQAKWLCKHWCFLKVVFSCTYLWIKETVRFW